MGEMGEMVDIDQVEIQLQKDVMKHFYGHPFLGKPKPVLFQFCRGDNIDYGVHEIDVARKMKRKSIPCWFCCCYCCFILCKEFFLCVKRSFRSPIDPIDPWNDILIAYSSVPGFVSNRNTKQGSWFFQCLIKVFRY